MHVEKWEAERLLDKKLQDTRTYPRRRTPARAKKYTLSMEAVENYVVLDFETTGLRAGDDKIIQIGAVKYIGHKQQQTMYLMINPERAISSTITRITGIQNRDVENAPVIEEIAPQLVGFIGDLPIVAHNAPFDMGFLYALEQFTPIPPYQVIDTVRLARKFITETPNHKLTTLSAYLELEHNAHDALGDCLVTASIYQFCIGRM
ncbi:exonuclease domain-containing protein [Planococcus sp. ISL-109]|uniref:3'-5' exonuclease n=1 Tax=Planococcus sp. ISL-109 TaxID=2819166 RepID=UPI00203637E3|nr:exonuclease domain-containing protein [Planococcus sp. ISL-109]